MRGRIFIFLPAVFILALYLSTLTGVHTYDALSYILDVDRKPWRELFHPHHLAYGPLGAMIHGLALALGWQGSVGVLLQATNAIAGALGVLLFTIVSTRASRHIWAGCLGGLLLGSSYAYWYYAVEVEVYTIAALFLIGALGLLLELVRRPDPRLAVALGVVQGLAVLFHQTNVLLCVPVFVALVFLTKDERRKTRDGGSFVRLGVAYGLPLAVIVGGAYLGVGLGVSGFRSWDQLNAWLSGYARTGFWGGAIDGAKWIGLGTGLAESLVWLGGSLIGLLLLGVLLINLGGLTRLPRAALAVLLTWLLVYGGFFLWWEPDNIEFWIAGMPPFYMLLILAISQADIPGNNGKSFYERLPLVLSLFTTGALVLVMLWINLGAIRERGDAWRDEQRTIAAALAEQSAAGDLIIVPDGMLELYLPYYEARTNVFSLNQAMIASGGDWSRACRRISERIDETLAGGYAVLAEAEALHPLPAALGEAPTPMERYGLSSDQVAACYTALMPMLSPLDLGAGLPQAYRISAAQELADGAGWDFRRGSWGWHVTGFTASAQGPAGWVFTPALDPAISSPPLQIDTMDVTAIELRLAASTTARDAQIFFVDESGLIAEARSLRWKLQPGSEMQTYRLDLRGAPGWEGVIGGLRLDPVGVGDGGQIVLESIRFIY